MTQLTRELSTDCLISASPTKITIRRATTTAASSTKIANFQQAASTLQKAISEIVFIDATVADYDSLVAGVKPGIATVILDSKQDGVAQISEYLTNCQDVCALHIICHGSPGSLQLGTAQLSLETLDACASQLQKWAASLSAKAEILLYGCSVAAGDRGQAFIQQISRLTKAKIAASTTLTGSADLGGDWQLQATTGEIEIDAPIHPETLKNYAFTLANLTTGTGDGGVTIGVDAFGSFGSSVGGTGGASTAFYNPTGTIPASSTTFQSGVAIRIGSTVGRNFLTSGTIGNSGGSNQAFTSTNSTNAQSTFTFGGLNFALTQTLTDLIVNGVKKGSLLTQTYRITNPVTAPAAANFELVRYMDGDLQFDNSINDSGGRTVSGTQEILFETETTGNNPTVSSTLLGITGIGGSTPPTGRYEINSYDGLLNRITAGTALSDIITGDGPDLDQFIDAAPYDVTLALRNTFFLQPGESGDYTTSTIFGTLPPNEVSNNIPVINITAIGSPAETNSTPGTFRLTRSGTGGQLINFNVAGSATLNSDYTATSSTPNVLFGTNNGTVLFPDTSTSVDITITPIDDNIFDPNENIQVTLAPSTNYILGTSRANLTIADNDSRDRKSVV